MESYKRLRTPELTEIHHHLRILDLIKSGHRLRILEQIENNHHLSILERSLTEIPIFSLIKCVGHIRNFIIFDKSLKTFYFVIFKNMVYI